MPDTVFHEFVCALNTSQLLVGSSPIMAVSAALEIAAGDKDDGDDDDRDEEEEEEAKEEDDENDDDDNGVSDDVNGEADDT